MSDKITIKKNPNGDTRTAKENVSFEEFQEANDSHRADVRNVMDVLSTMLKQRGITHDFTKKDAEQEFFADFNDARNLGLDFSKLQWYQMHVKKERHHLLSNCPDDVNLIDVLEMIVDCVCAGKARSGEVRDIELNEDILKAAITNTVKLIDDITKVEE